MSTLIDKIHTTEFDLELLDVEHLEQRIRELEWFIWIAAATFPEDRLFVRKANALLAASL